MITCFTSPFLPTFLTFLFRLDFSFPLIKRASFTLFLSLFEFATLSFYFISRSNNSATLPFCIVLSFVLLYQISFPLFSLLKISDSHFVFNYSLIWRLPASFFPFSTKLTTFSHSFISSKILTLLFS